MYSVALINAEQYDRRNMLRIHRRKLRDTSDPFEIPEERFIELYRFNRVTANILLSDISPHMAKGVRNTFIPHPIRLCSALHFFATGSFHRDIGQDFPACVSRSVVCRNILDVATILERKLMQKWIKFPKPSEYEYIKELFYNETGFPGVKRPRNGVESCYLNRKGYHSKNVQLICDFNLKILGGFGRFGGAAHDSYIWEASHNYRLAHGLLSEDDYDDAYDNKNVDDDIQHEQPLREASRLRDRLKERFGNSN